MFMSKGFLGSFRSFEYISFFQKKEKQLELELIWYFHTSFTIFLFIFD